MNGVVSTRIRRHRLRRGASLVEYVLLVGLVALAAFAGLRTFGKSAEAKAESYAGRVTRLEGAESEPYEASGAPSGTDNTGGNKKKPGFDPDKFKDATWKTIDGQPTITGEGDGRAVHPNDVAQGQLANCYLISSLAAIAQVNPELLEKNIEANGDGTYTVTLYKKADKPWWNPFASDYDKVEVRVTADFPVDKGGKPIFAQPGDSKDGKAELWVMLYEKAYAQLNGSYTAIGNGGNAGMALTTLTGRKSDEYAPKDLSFETFAKYVTDGNAVTAGTPEKSDHKLIKDGTLVGWHVYYVTGVDTKTRTVTVRNPWGWTPEPITMSWEDFQGAFTYTDVNRTR